MAFIPNLLRRKRQAAGRSAAAIDFPSAFRRCSLPTVALHPFMQPGSCPAGQSASHSGPCATPGSPYPWPTAPPKRAASARRTRRLSARGVHLTNCIEKPANLPQSVVISSNYSGASEPRRAPPGGEQVEKGTSLRSLGLVPAVPGGGSSKNPAAYLLCHPFSRFRCDKRWCDVIAPGSEARHITAAQATSTVLTLIEPRHDCRGEVRGLVDSRTGIVAIEGISRSDVPLEEKPRRIFFTGFRSLPMNEAKDRRHSPEWTPDKS